MVVGVAREIGSSKLLFGENNGREGNIVYTHEDKPGESSEMRVRNLSKRINFPFKERIHPIEPPSLNPLGSFRCLFRPNFKIEKQLFLE